LPEGQVKAFIERLVGPMADDLQQFIVEAEAAAARGGFDEAVALFSEVLAQDDNNLKAIGGLARVYVLLGKLDAARELLQQVAQGQENDSAISAARAALELAEQAASVGDLAALEKAVAVNPLDFQAQFDLALALNARGAKEAAAERLLEIIRRDRKWNDDGARKQLVQFFEAWGPMDEATVAGRRKLSALLFS
jgi:putative thioredoxin